MNSTAPRLLLSPLGPLTFSLAAQLLMERWHDTTLVSKGLARRLEDVEGYLAWLDDEIVGVVTFVQERQSIQVVSMDSFRDGLGTGKALHEAIVQTATERKCNRIWLVVTNDNLDGLSFFQKHGWNICLLHCNSMEIARWIKPGIPLTGINGIPIRHEIELEILISN